MARVIATIKGLGLSVSLEKSEAILPQVLPQGRLPQGGLAFARLWGLANPRSRSQGDRRDKRPAYVSPYVPRREGRRECKAVNYGYILSSWPWVVAHPGS